MRTTPKLAAFVVGLVAAFGAAFGVGQVVGPVDDVDTEPTSTEPARTEQPADRPAGHDADHGTTP